MKLGIVELSEGQRKFSDQELRKRYQLEKNYLKSQMN